jgi:hypothetical protein
MKKYLWFAIFPVELLDNVSPVLDVDLTRNLSKRNALASQVDLVQKKFFEQNKKNAGHNGSLYFRKDFYHIFILVPINELSLKTCEPEPQVQLFSSEFVTVPHPKEFERIWLDSNPNKKK